VGIFSFGRGGVPVGLDIGSNSIHAVQLKPAGGQYSLVRFGTIRIPMGAVVEGEVVDIEAVGHSISQLWRKAGFSEKHVITGVANQKVVVRMVEFPAMDKQELDSALRFQAQDYIPIPIDEAILDFEVVGEYTNVNDERMLEVLLVAAQRDMIGNHLAAIERAGLKTNIIDASAFAIVRSLIDPEGVLPAETEGDVPEATGIIHVSAGLTIIVVVERGRPRFTRVSSLAGNDFTQSIADALNLTFDEAEDLKQAAGLPPLGGEERLPVGFPVEKQEMGDAAQEILERQVSKFIAEIRRSLDYYLTQATQVRAIRKLVLSGGGANLANLDSYLEKGLQAGVVLGKPLRNIKVAPAVSADEIAAEEASLPLCLGLALRGLQQ